MNKQIKSTFHQHGFKIEETVSERTSENYRKKIEGLHEASRSLVSAGNFKDVLNQCAKIAEDLVSAEGVTIYLLKEEEGTLEAMITRENYAEQILSTTLKVGEGVTGKVALSGKAEMVNRVDLTNKGKQIPGTPLEPESLISIPIKVRNKVIGVMTVSRLGKREFVDDDFKLLEHLANISASAMENARLFNRTLGVEKDLVDARKQAQVSDRMKKSFISTMSHEVRTPLNSILGFATILESELKHQLTQTQQEFLKIINRSGLRLKSIIEEILELSEIESDQLALKLERLHGNDLVKESLDEMREMARQKNLGVLESYDSLDPWIMADVKRFRKALGNLLENAVKYTKSGSISVSTGLSGNDYTITISDTGIGIKEEFRPHLFKMFRQGDDGMDRSYEGMGLGLAVAHRLVSAMGGTIQVESEVGKGSRFTVKFPVKGGPVIVNNRHRAPSAEKGGISPPMIMYE